MSNQRRPCPELRATIISEVFAVVGHDIITSVGKNSCVLSGRQNMVWWIEPELMIA